MFAPTLLFSHPHPQLWLIPIFSALKDVSLEHRAERFTCAWRRSRSLIPPGSCLQRHLLEQAGGAAYSPVIYEPTCFPGWRVCAISSVTCVTDKRVSSPSSQKATGPDGVLMGGSLLMASTHQAHGSMVRKKYGLTNQVAPAGLAIMYIIWINISCHDWANEQVPALHFAHTRRFNHPWSSGPGLQHLAS